MTAAFPRHAHYDAIIVGARCAGAATALLLARDGLRVLALDRGRYDTDTLSTHALMRGGVLQLERWGALGAIRAAGTPPVRVTTFYYDGEPVPVSIKPRDGVDALFAPRRRLLDRVLVDVAREAGAEIVHGHRVVDLLRAAGRVTGVVARGEDGREWRIDADLVIGADGLRSSVARLVGAEPTRVGRHATAVVYGYWPGVELEGYRWYFRPGAGAGAIPTNDGEACVFASIPAERFADTFRGEVEVGYRRVLGEVAPELAGSLRAAGPTGGFHGFSGQVGFMRRCAGPGWALVGDAAYFKDPLTAHGITDALRDAELLARAVREGGDAALAAYETERDALSTGLFDVTGAIASFEWDLETLRSYHKRLSEQMALEVQALASLHAGEQPDRRFAETSIRRAG